MYRMDSIQRAYGSELEPEWYDWIFKKVDKDSNIYTIETKAYGLDRKYLSIDYQYKPTL